MRKKHEFVQPSMVLKHSLLTFNFCLSLLEWSKGKVNESKRRFFFISLSKNKDLSGCFKSKGADFVSFIYYKNSYFEIRKSNFYYLYVKKLNKNNSTNIL